MCLQVFRILVRALCRGAASASFACLRCVVLAGTGEGLESPRVLVGTPCRCCGTE